MISQSQQQSLFTSNQEEADTRRALHCSEGSKPVFQNFGKTTSCAVSFSYWLRYRPPLLWRIKNIEKLGELATASEDLLYQIMSFIQKYVYRGKTNEKLVEKRMRQYNTMKTKTTQIILPDPHSLKLEELTYKHTIGAIIQNIT